MIRALSLCAALAGGVAASQYPAFAQDYLQRLAGQVDALDTVVKDFDASALAAGLGRQEALEQMVGTPFLVSRRADMERTFRRHAVLSDDLARLRAAGPLARLTMPHRLHDRQTLTGTWADFEPALPLTPTGAIAALAGAALAWLAARLAGATARGFLARPQPRRRAPKEPARPTSRARTEPTLRPAAPAKVYRLEGARR